MTPPVGFVTFLLVTVALLGAVVVTGRAARRRAHLTLVAITVVSLGTTIWFAEKLGELYDLEAAGWITPVHLTLAKLTTLLYLAPVITGVMTLRNAVHRPKHRAMAWTVITMTLLTAATGTWMILASEPLEV